jgi:hypothetical protein
VITVVSLPAAPKAAPAIRDRCALGMAAALHQSKAVGDGLRLSFLPAATAMNELP